MIRTITASWPLFFGLGLIMIGNGLQGTLLGIRASIEGFDTAAIGIIMSLYYLGFLGGSYYVPKMISKVGHIRVFTALASIASATVLIHGLYPDPIIWALVRLFTGFAYAGLYIIVESWLNNTSTNKTRGKIFGVYQLVSYGGMMMGQYMLNIADPAMIDLFVMASILVSIAILPIALSSRPAPEFDEPEHMSMKRLFVISPLGMAGAFANGIGVAAVFGLGAVYANEMGMTIPQISTFIALYILGGVAFQMPISWVSDKYDRRLVINIVSVLAAITAFVCFIVSDSPYVLNAVFFILGGLSLTIYGLSMSHINDHLTPRQYVGASSSAILVNGMGAAAGPLVISTLMSLFGTKLYFPAIAIIFGGLFVYGLYRTQKRESLPLDEQGDYMQVPLRATPISMTITEEGHAIMKEMDDD